MKVTVRFHSYLKEITGHGSVEEELLAGANVEQLLKSLYVRFPKLAAMQSSTLVAVDVDYVGKSHILQPGDDVSLIPPVSGG